MTWATPPRRRVRVADYPSFPGRQVASDPGALSPHTNGCFRALIPDRSCGVAKISRRRAHQLATQSIQIDAALNAVRRAQFGVTDILRRLQGDAIAAFGLGPSECP